MSDFFNKYPYTDFHEMNLDWIIERVKKLTEDWASTLEEWNNTEEQWQELYNYVHDYFDNLDVQQEINNKINAMIADGTFVTITTPVIEAKVASMMPATVAAQIGDTVASQIGTTVAGQLPDVVTDQIGDAVVTPVNIWLSENITQPTTPVVDTSLSISGAAADSAVTGEKITNIKRALDVYGDEVENESYSSSLPINMGTVSIPTGMYGIPIPNDTSLVKEFEAGKTYFGYVELTISNLTGYVAGNWYLQWSYLISQPAITDYYAGTTYQAITNGKIKLYGFFTSSEGSSRPTISARNTSNAYSCQITIDKIFLVETNIDYSTLFSHINNIDYLYLPELPDEVVTYESLSDDMKKIIPSDSSTIIDCWGDSLTQGAGSTDYPYPTKLQDLLGSDYTVNNYGQGSETAEDIAFRQGSLAGIVNPFDIVSPAITKDITGKFVNGADFGPLNISGLYNGNNRVYIDNNPFMFRRTGAGTFYVGLLSDTSSTHGYSRPQLMIAEGKGTGHIPIICIGQNGWKDSDPYSLADIIRTMIDYNHSTQYLVIGRPTGDNSSRSAEETILADTFNEHFINMREYISTYGLSDNSLTPTAEDTAAMAIGAIPPSLRSDSVHLNDYGYISMAICIKQRGQTLKYWN